MASVPGNSPATVDDVHTYNGVSEYELPYRGMTPGMAFCGRDHSTVLSWTTEDGVRQQTIDTYVGWSDAEGFPA